MKSNPRLNEFKVYEHPTDSSKMIEIKRSWFTIEEAIKHINSIEGQKTSPTSFLRSVKQTDPDIFIPKVGYPMQSTSKDAQYDYFYKHLYIEPSHIGRPPTIYNYAMVNAAYDINKGLHKIEYDEIINEQKLVDIINAEDWKFKFDSIFEQIFIEEAIKDKSVYAPLIEKLTDSIELHTTHEYIKLSDQSKRLIEQNKKMKERWNWAVSQTEYIYEKLEQINILEDMYIKNKSVIDNVVKEEASKVMNKLNDLENEIKKNKNSN